MLPLEFGQMKRHNPTRTKGWNRETEMTVRKIAQIADSSINNEKCLQSETENWSRCVNHEQRSSSQPIAGSS